MKQIERRKQEKKTIGVNFYSTRTTSYDQKMQVCVNLGYLYCMLMRTRWVMHFSLLSMQDPCILVCGKD